MARADRLARTETLRVEREGDYRDALIAALTAAASGRQGLFDHTRDRRTRAAIAPVVDELVQIGEEIDAMREQLGMPPFALHHEFLKSRGPVGPQAVGERKQAQAWLNRLATDVE
ncbi:hypothetical protein ASE73_17065 [Sphingomonas sp. Leaf24]|uniref:hypothetical protein n=1 Tax=unclassified Sphingomonas TaxID=196159 RepID=UPI0006F966AF|nr:MULTISPECIES: hypothetical protein [unclassified Sphingomonas]KQM20488.1 hypothetical protein ASE50_16280 [Sphingomonas sp. Leaf5]KQM92329.1 hypothetical protein ASE73_17065 [Sphingomonas sp. Leaf24]